MPLIEAHFPRSLQVAILVQDLSSPTTLDQVSLRYINQIPLPFQGEVNIGDFITLDPPLPPKLGETLTDFFQRYELRYEDPEGLLLHQTGMEIDASEPYQYVALDLEFISPVGFGPGPEKAAGEVFARVVDQTP